MEETEQNGQVNEDNTNLLTMIGLKKSGYLEVKQPSNIKGRKLKTWKKKWVVVHKMTDLAVGTFAAKFFLYSDEDSTKQATSEKQAYIFDHVTAVQHAKSKTRPLAFQIVQEAPALMLSGFSEQETQDWITSLKELFWPEESKPAEDTFRVTVEQNEDAKIWSLSGDYWLSVSPEIISIKSMKDSSIQEWNLNFIKRFFMDKTDVNILIIETGSISEFGEAHFRFKSTLVPDILAVIKRNIQTAIKLRESRSKSSESFSIVQSSLSAISSDKSFKTLLNRSSENAGRVSRMESYLMRSRNNSERSTSSSSSSSVGEYNSLETSVSRENDIQIVSTVTVCKDDGKDIEVKFDLHGYSHVEPTTDIHNECNQLQVETKARSISGCAVSDDENKRSTSVCSFDSGFAQGNIDSNNDEVLRRKHTNNNSFDSGISASLISASIGEIFIMTEQHSKNSHNNSICSFVPYSQIAEMSSTNNTLNSLSARVSDNGDYSSIYWDTDTKETCKKENLYEDLDKYRKDLSKHLGFDPKINPTEVPPSLPDRPSTLPTRRKTRSKSTKKKDKKTTIQEIFKTVTRGRTGSVSSSSSNTSECDDDKLNMTLLSNRQKWPLANTAISGRNDLYTSVPDEGVFSSGRPRARSYEDRPNKMLDGSIVSVNNWPVGGKSGMELNTAILYDPIYSKVNKKDRAGNSEIETRRSLKRSNSSIDLMIYERSRLRQQAVDLLTGEENLVTRHTDILTPVLVSPQDEPDFIDFSTEIDMSSSITNSYQTDFSDNTVWNPFPKIADFTNNIKTIPNQDDEDFRKLETSDPFDSFHIGLISSRLGLSSNSPLNYDHKAEKSDLDRTIYNPNEDIYMDMGNETLQQEQTVDYVLPTDVSRTNKE